MNVQLAGTLHSNTKLLTSHCQTGGARKGVCLLGLVLFNIVINDLDNGIPELLSAKTGRNKKPKTFKEHYDNWAWSWWSAKVVWQQFNKIQ